MALTPQGPALSLILVSAILLFFSWLAVILRMTVRNRIKALGLDDWLMVLGLMFFTATCQATITGSFFGIGSVESQITSAYERRARMWFMLFQLFYIASTAFIKSSICVALLRITVEPAIRYILYTTISLVIIACIVTDVAVLTWCRPVAATWDPSRGKCADTSVITKVSYFISAASILTDYTCAVLPVVILWDIQLRFRIKASVAIVLGFGFVASTATLVRIKYLRFYDKPTDNYLFNIAHIAIWSMAEAGLGLIAGSLATLRPLLRYLSLLSTTKTSEGATRSQPLQAMQSSNITGSQRVHISIDGDEWEILSDTEMQRFGRPPVEPEPWEINVVTEVEQTSRIKSREGDRELDLYHRALKWI